MRLGINKLNARQPITVGDGAGVAGDVVILNYINGLFGQGTKTAAGTIVSLQSGFTNSLVLKGQATANSIAFGANGRIAQQRGPDPRRHLGEHPHLRRVPRRG